jgi:hypothetical protein
MKEIKIGNAYAKNETEALRIAKEHFQYGNVTRVERNNNYSPMCHEWDAEKNAWVSNYWKVFGLLGREN